jgi:uncharacterized protein (DUF433 family)
MSLPDFLRLDPEGEIFLQGHRITLYHVLSRVHAGLSPNEIVALFPTLDLELVNRIIKYYDSNRAELDQYLERIRMKLERQEAAGRRVDSAKLRQRFSELHPEGIKELHGN